MKPNVTQLHNVDPEEFKNEILDGIKEQLESFKLKIAQEKTPPYLTRKNVSTLLGVSLVTIHEWSKKGILKPYRIGNRVRFKFNEIEDVLNNSRE